MAGESARESARRQREKATRLQRSAEMYERGADGEGATAMALGQLPSEYWTVLHDVHWPGRRFANVDHVAIGPPGVFVIDSKNWSGRIEVADSVLRQNGRSRQTAVAGAAESAMAVAGLVPRLEPDHVRPVLCFVRGESVTGWARDVVLCSTANVVQMLTSRPAVLTPDEVRTFAAELDAGVGRAPSPSSSRSVARRSESGLRPSMNPGYDRRLPRAHRRRQRSVRGDLVRLGIAVAAALTLLTQPELVSSMGERVADKLVGIAEK